MSCSQETWKHFCQFCCFEFRDKPVLIVDSGICFTSHIQIANLTPLCSLKFHFHRILDVIVPFTVASCISNYASLHVNLQSSKNCWSNSVLSFLF